MKNGNGDLANDLQGMSDAMDMPNLRLFHLGIILHDTPVITCADYKWPKP